MLQAAHHDNALAGAWVVRVMDQDINALFLGSISLARPASAKVGLPVPSATRPAATTARCSTSAFPKLFADLALARGDGRYARIMRSLNGAQLLILDDWGLDPLDAGARRDLYEILEERYGRRSTILTSQVPIDKWHAVIGDPTYADAILDRLVHNAHRIDLAGDSLRRTRPRASRKRLTAAAIPAKNPRSAGRLKRATSCRNSERHDLGMTGRHRRNE